MKDTLVVDDSWDSPGGAGEQQDEAGETREERLAVECTRLQAAYQVATRCPVIFSVCLGCCAVQSAAYWPAGSYLTWLSSINNGLAGGLYTTTPPSTA